MTLRSYFTGVTWQIWTWLKGSNFYFCQIKISRNAEINGVLATLTTAQIIDGVRYLPTFVLSVLWLVCPVGETAFAVLPFAYTCKLFVTTSNRFQHRLVMPVMKITPYWSYTVLITLHCKGPYVLFSKHGNNNRLSIFNHINAVSDNQNQYRYISSKPNTINGIYVLLFKIWFVLQNHRCRGESPKCDRWLVTYFPFQLSAFKLIYTV